VGVSEIQRLTGNERILLAVEAGPDSRILVAAAAKLAQRLHADVLVLSVRERAQARGVAWDVIAPGELAEVVSHAIYELRRLGIRAQGIIGRARVGRVADEIVYAAEKYHADEIMIGLSSRNWLGRLLYSSVSPRVLRLSEFPVVAIPVRRHRDTPPAVRRPADRFQPAA
jgi:nucleotide-binding universal stress UspA family protein